MLEGQWVGEVMMTLWRCKAPLVGIFKGALGMAAVKLTKCKLERFETL